MSQKMFLAVSACVTSHSFTTALVLNTHGLVCVTLCMLLYQATWMNAVWNTLAQIPDHSMLWSGGFFVVCLFVCFCECCFLYLEKHPGFITGSKAFRFLPIAIPQHVSIELVIYGLDGIAQTHPSWRTNLLLSLIHCKIMYSTNGFLKLSKVWTCSCTWFVPGHIFRVRDKSVEWVISLHVYMDFQDWTEVIRLAKQVLLPTELFCYPLMSYFSRNCFMIYY